MNGLIGKKVGMTSYFSEEGVRVACTVIELEPNVVTQIKTDEVDGYSAVQLGSVDKKEKNTPQSLQGHFKKAGTSPKKNVKEFKDIELEKAVGESISVEEIFAEGDKVIVSALSKGKGFQGVVKRHGFAGVGDATHGQHNRLRAPGAVGACSYPAKVFKGTRMAGRMGGKKVTVKNLNVEKIFSEENLILVKGAVPGHKGSIVVIQKK